MGLKAGQVKRRKLQKYHLSHFLGKMGFFGDDAFHNTFVYQSTYNTLE